MTTTHRITTTVAAVVLSLAAAGAPTATATVSGTDPATTATQAPATVYSRPDKSMIRATTPGNASQAVVRIQTPPSGFAWGDAGIGAAGGLALATIGLGGALIVSQRPRRSRQTTPLNSPTTARSSTTHCVVAAIGVANDLTRSAGGPPACNVKRAVDSALPAQRGGLTRTPLHR
jgi:hypothetical protein